MLCTLQLFKTMPVGFGFGMYDSAVLASIVPAAYNSKCGMLSADCAVSPPLHVMYRCAHLK